MRRLVLASLAAAAFSACTPLAAAEPAAAPSYASDVRPIFRRYCYECHSSEKATSELALDSYKAVMRGGASGKIVVRGEPDGSRLWLLVSHTESPSMPPEADRLPKKSLDVIRAWIRGGAIERAAPK